MGVRYVVEFKTSLLGKINFVKMVNPKTGNRLLEQLGQLSI
jgi:hypothetical protein